MRIYLSALVTLTALTTWGQTKDSTAANIRLSHRTYLVRSVTATVSVGFADENRQDYAVPYHFTKGEVTGFAPIFAKLEYGLTKDVSVAAMFSYDAFVYNLQENYTGNNGPFTRYVSNNTRIATGGVAAFYHLHKILRVKRLDPFVGVGLELNNVRYHALPQGDSTIVKINHTLTPYVKAGVRYYISDRFSIYGDLGYERQAYLTVGFSCRFFNKRSM